MHENTDNFNRPTLVKRFLEDAVLYFAFSAKNSACFVPTAMKRITPSVGPQKSMKTLEIYGSGFWDSKEILVKFSRTGMPGVPARSTLGKFVDDHVVCKPPRLAEPGLYDISITMDGKLFVSNFDCTLAAFADPTIVEVSPMMVNLRLTSSSTFDLALVGSHFDSMPELEDSIVVMLRNVNQGEAAVGSVTQGTLVREQNQHSVGAELYAERSMSITSVTSDHSTSAASKHTASVAESNAHQHTPHYRTVVTQAAAAPLVSTDGDADFLSVQVSLNGTDFSIPCDTLIFAHSFYAAGISPNVVCLDSSDPVAFVAGDGLFNPNVYEYDAILSIFDINNTSCLATTRLLVNWHSLESLSIRIPNLSSLIQPVDIDDDEDREEEGGEKEESQEALEEGEQRPSRAPIKNYIPSVMACTLSLVVNIVYKLPLLLKVDKELFCFHLSNLTD
jgi:hypothetical protein